MDGVCFSPYAPAYRGTRDSTGGGGLRGVGTHRRVFADGKRGREGNGREGRREERMERGGREERMGVFGIGFGLSVGWGRG